MHIETRMERVTGRNDNREKYVSTGQGRRKT